MGVGRVPSCVMAETEASGGHKGCHACVPADVVNSGCTTEPASFAQTRLIGLAKVVFASGTLGWKDPELLKSAVIHA